MMCGAGALISSYHPGGAASVSGTEHGSRSTSYPLRDGGAVWVSGGMFGLIAEGPGSRPSSRHPLLGLAPRRLILARYSSAFALWTPSISTTWRKRSWAVSRSPALKAATAFRNSSSSCGLLTPDLLTVLVDVSHGDLRAVEVEHGEAEQGPALEAALDEVAEFPGGRRWIGSPLPVRHVDGHPAVADAAGVFDALRGVVEHAAVLVTPEPAPHPSGLEHGADLIDQFIFSLLIGAEDLVMGEEQSLARRAREHPLGPGGLAAVQVVLVPGGVKPEDRPVIVAQGEVAGALLAGEAAVFQSVVEEGVPTRVHVVIAVEVPRGDARRLARLHGPPGEEAVAVLVFPPRVVDVAEMDGVLLAAGRKAFFEDLSHLARHLARPGDPRAPVADNDEPGLVAEGDRIGRLLGEGALAPEFADPLGEQAAQPADVGHREFVEDPPVVLVPSRLPVREGDVGHRHVLVAPPAVVGRRGLDLVSFPEVLLQGGLQVADRGVPAEEGEVVDRRRLLPPAFGRRRLESRLAAGGGGLGPQRRFRGLQRQGRVLRRQLRPLVVAPAAVVRGGGAQVVPDVFQLLENEVAIQHLGDQRGLPPGVRGLRKL